MSDSSSQFNSEPSTGTDLDDDNVRELDDAELQGEDTVPVDEQAEIEAARFPLLPAQRIAAEREMDARDLGQDRSDIPNAVRRQELEKF